MKPGVYTISKQAYQADDVGCDAPTLTASIACILLNASPKHAWAAHPKLGGALQAESEIFDLGTAAHAYLLEGREDHFVIVEADDWRTKLARAARDAARAEGKVPMLARHLDSVKHMADAIRRQLAAFEEDPAPFTNGRPEQTLVWQERVQLRPGQEQLVSCRARLDWLHDDHSTIDDLKTGGVSAKPDAWARTLYNARKDVQAAFYSRGVKAVFGIDPLFRFVVAENTPPYATSVISLSKEGMAHAHDQVEQAIQRWARCLADDTWPAYPTRTCYVDPPAWAIAQWMDDGPVAAAGNPVGNWERS